MPYPRQLEDRADVDADEHARGARARLDAASPESSPSLVALLLAVADVLPVALGADAAAAADNPGDDVVAVQLTVALAAAAVVVPAP